MTKAMEMQGETTFPCEKVQSQLNSSGHGLHVNKDNFPPGVNEIHKIKTIV